jgi:AraC-like DNA-binding protein
LLLFPSSEYDREEVLLRFTGMPQIQDGVMLLVYRENLSPQFQQWLCQSLYPDKASLLGRGYGIPLIALFPAGNPQSIHDSLHILFRNYPESQDIRAVIIPWQERNNIPLAFRDAVKALDKAKRGFPVLIVPNAERNAMPSIESSPRGFPYETEDALLASLEQGRFDEIDPILKQLCEFFESENLHIPEAVDHVAELIAIIRRSAYRCGYHLVETFAVVPLRILLTFRDLSSGIKVLRELVGQYKYEAGQKVDNLPIWKLSRAFLYVRKNLYGELGLELVAEEVGLSPQYLSKRFKEEYGKSFTEYVTTERIHKARFLLGTTDMSVKAICSSIGYADANYFSRVFKKETGMTPQQYRDRVSDSTVSSIGTTI